jgi:predicted HAD superfamily Cof-like phosphohydrolase
VLLLLEDPVNTQAKVREFHEAFGRVIRDEPQPWIDPEEVELCHRLHLEELVELFEAMTGVELAPGAVDRIAEAFDAECRQGMPRDVSAAAVARELGDLEYVLNSTALNYGIDMEPVIEEIHRANMSKLGVDGQPVLRDDGKVLKGPCFTPPDVAGVLDLRRAA